MAVEGEEPEYESDPEDALLPSAMRRREASDDEEGGGDGEDAGTKSGRVDRRGGVASEGDSEGEGGAPGYDDDEEYEEGEEEDLLDEEEEEEEEEEEVEYEEVHEVERSGGAEEFGGDRLKDGEENGDRDGGDQVEEEEKKENEPFAVPTAGAFYMHDDRFRESRGGWNRRTPGGRKLWESKDDHAWVHDRFEEMNLQEGLHNEERRTYKGRYRGRGKTRGIGRGYGRGNRPRGYDDRSSRAHNDRPQTFDDRGQAYDERSQAYDDKKNSSRAPRAVRGRGPRRYEPLPNNNSSNNNNYNKNKREMPANRNKQSGKLHEQASSNASGRQSSQTSSSQHEPIITRKQVFASSLNSASPPFYPSGSSNQDPSATSNRDIQTGGSNRSVTSSMLETNFTASHSSSVLRGKAVVDYVGQERLHMDNSCRQVSRKSLGNLPMPSSGSSSPSPVGRVQGRGPSVTSGQLTYQQSTLPNQVTRVPPPVQLPGVQQRPVHAPAQPVLQVSSQFGQRPSSGTSAVQSTNASEVGDSESPTGLSKSKALVAGKEKASAQGGGRGTFLYGGAQFIGPNGALGLAHGDQSFPGAPALLPVMQFNGQGMPAVGMALPAYVANPQLGFGSSEMAWLPMLPGATGALGASYAPYITLDSGFQARQTGQTSSSATSKEAGTAKPASAWKSPQRSELENDEFGQRQNKPRRYSEMNFGQ